MCSVCPLTVFLIGMFAAREIASQTTVPTVLHRRFGTVHQGKTKPRRLHGVPLPGHAGSWRSAKPGPRADVLFFGKRQVRSVSVKLRRGSLPSPRHHCQIPVLAGRVSRACFSSISAKLRPELLPNEPWSPVWERSQGRNNKHNEPYLKWYFFCLWSLVNL